MTGGPPSVDDTAGIEEVEEMGVAESIGTMAVLMGFAVGFFSCLWWVGEIMRYVLDSWGPAGLASSGLLIGIGLISLGMGVLWVHSKNTGESEP